MTSVLEVPVRESVPEPVEHGARSALIIVYLALGGLSFAVLQSLVAPALSNIGSDIGASTGNVSWILTAYLLSASVLTPILGRLGDMVGKRKVLIVVLVLLLAGTIVSALATSLGVLIVGRALQGAAGAVLPLSIGIVRDELPPERVGVTIGLLSAIFGIGAGVGIVAAGPIVEHLSWHWLFWLPGVLVLIALLGAIFGIKESPVRKPGRLDVVGTAILSVSLVSLLLAVTEGEKWGWGSGKTITLFIVGGITLIAFVLVELKVREPLIDVRLFKIRGVWTAHVIALTFGFAMFGTFVLVPTLLKLPSVLGYGFGKSVSQAGLLLLPTVGMMVVAGPVAGILVRRIGAKVPLLIGALAVTGAFVVPAVSHDHLWQIVVSGLLTGAGIGFALSTMSNVIIQSVPAQQTGEAISANTVVRTIGSSVGTAVIAAIIASQSTPRGIPTDDAFTIGFWACAGVGGLAILAALVAPGVQRLRQRASTRTAAMHAEPRHSANGSVNAMTINGQDDQDAPHLSGQTVQLTENPTVADAVPETLALTISGTIRQSGNRALAGAQVTLADQTGRQVARTVSDETGGYVLRLENGGTYLLIVAATDLAPTAGLVGVIDQPVVRDVMLAGRSTLTGRVLLHESDGEGLVGVADALLTLTDVTGEVVGSTRSRTNGEYTFERLTAGSYVLTAQGEDYRPLARSVEVTDAGVVACDLTISAGGRLTGTVVAASSGRGVPEATVTLTDPQGQVVATTTTFDDGGYVFDNLEPSPYTVTAAGYAPVALSVVVDEDAVSSLRVELGSPATVVDEALPEMSMDQP